MQTRFSTQQLTDLPTADAAQAMRGCVHCGFCTATCPTYVLLGDELDSPRGRIYLIKEMLEKSAQPSAAVVKHVDRCLSCLSCESHCPSGVSYRRVIDKGRAYIEAHYRRPWAERLIRGVLSNVLPHRRRFRVALALAACVRPFAGVIDAVPGMRGIGTMLRLSGAGRPSGRAVGQSGGAAPGGRAVGQSGGAVGQSGVAAPNGEAAPGGGAAGRSAAVSDTMGLAGAMFGGAMPGLARRRVGLARGCVEPVLDPATQAATERLLRRAGCEVVRVDDACCGSLLHHMGQEAKALAMARATVDAWQRAIDAGGLEAIIITASGCGTLIRDYGHLLREDSEYAARAARVSALACDVSEWLQRTGLPPRVDRGPITVAYHPACSLQHGQKIRSAPSAVLEAAGFKVRLPVDSHLCCGSAGVYNILQPEIAERLGRRKSESLAALQADVIATGNIGCRIQISRSAALPVVHVAELLDWATGGAKPF